MYATCKMWFNNLFIDLLYRWKTQLQELTKLPPFAKARKSHFVLVENWYPSYWLIAITMHFTKLYMNTAGFTCCFWSLLQIWQIHQLVLNQNTNFEMSWVVNLKETQHTNLQAIDSKFYRGVLFGKSYWQPVNLSSSQPLTKRLYFY